MDEFTACEIAYKNGFDAGLKTGLNADNWISVLDDLPKESGYYLVYGAFISGGVAVSAYSVKHGLFNCEDTDTEEYAKEKSLKSITHWQLLPEPPKED